MRIVAALGGNALLERGESPDAGIQEAHVTSVTSRWARSTAGGSRASAARTARSVQSGFGRAT